MPRFPVTEPFDAGLLDVGDGNLMYYEQVGDPEGVPVAIVHGGPGSGCSVTARGALDPARYRAILFDQRNCGRSLPHAADPAVDLSRNTTQNLVADMELLREHVGLERWMLHGGSWGSTLILAYAETHPERVTGALIPAVTITDSDGVAWLYEGVGRIFPEAQERFREYIPAEERGESVFDLLAAYGRLMQHPDPEVRARTAAEWVAWEDAVISQEVNGTPGNYSLRMLDEAREAFVRICAHYFSNTAFLEDGQLLGNAHRLAGIPAVFVHGRNDLGGPVKAAWELAKAWPGSELVVVEDSGHTGSTAFSDAIRSGIRRLTERIAGS
ncbi:prolyl aminopeptidase [Actinospica acidithermotolerans]|nr:prolyl aminopeptidase [Actinospica acidithermotolerans]